MNRITPEEEWIAISHPQETEEESEADNDRTTVS